MNEEQKEKIEDLIKKGVKPERIKFDNKIKRESETLEIDLLEIKF